MCLVTNSEKEIAQEDMVVYKVLDKDFISLHAYFQYELDKLYQTEIKETERDTVLFADIIDSNITKVALGIKSTSSLFGLTKGLLPKGVKVYGQGYHFYFTKERAFDEKYYSCITLECIIPKGSEIYRNPSGLGVANQIIIKSIV
jgi:hypothetical protein